MITRFRRPAAAQELEFMGCVGSDEGAASASPPDFEWDGRRGWWALGERARGLLDLRASKRFLGWIFHRAGRFSAGCDGSKPDVGYHHALRLCLYLISPCQSIPHPEVLLQQQQPRLVLLLLWILVRRVFGWQ